MAKFAITLFNRPSTTPQTVSGQFLRKWIK